MLNTMKFYKYTGLVRDEQTKKVNVYKLVDYANREITLTKEELIKQLEENKIYLVNELGGTKRYTNDSLVELQDKIRKNYGVISRYTAIPNKNAKAFKKLFSIKESCILVLLLDSIYKDLMAINKKFNEREYIHNLWFENSFINDDRDMNLEIRINHEEVEGLHHVLCTYTDLFSERYTEKLNELYKIRSLLDNKQDKLAYLSLLISSENRIYTVNTINTYLTESDELYNQVQELFNKQPDINESATEYIDLELATHYKIRDSDGQLRAKILKLFFSIVNYTYGVYWNYYYIIGDCVAEAYYMLDGLVSIKKLINADRT